MCQTTLISQNIVRLSKRSYSQRLESVVPHRYRISQLSRLNKDLDNLYEALYCEWQSVTEEDYAILGPQLEILLETIKGLYHSCNKYPKEMGFYNEAKRLGMNYAALYEINSDIVNFKIKLPKDPEVKQIMSRLSEVDDRLRRG